MHDADATDLFRYSPHFENTYFTETCSGSEAGSYLRRIDFVYHSTLDLRVIKKKKTCFGFRVYRGTSFIRNRLPLGPYSRDMPRPLCWS